MDKDGDTTPPVSDQQPIERLRGLLRTQLTPTQREMHDLGYLDSAASGFAVNPVTTLVMQARSSEDASAPFVTLYAQPTEPGPSPIDLLRVHEWLEPNNHRYEPLPGQLFVPSGSRRGIADAVLVSSYSDLGLRMRFLVVRRSGTVEIGPASVWRWPHDAKPWIIDSRRLIAQFAQFLRSLIRLCTDFQRPGGWRVFINIRGAQGATLGDFAQGWAPPFDFRGETTFCIEPHLQLELAFGGTEKEIDERVREAATRLELAFGFCKSRVYNERTGVAELSGVTY